MTQAAIENLDSAYGEVGTAVPARISGLRRWVSFLEEPVDGASLAVFRMCFAACMIANFVFFHDKFMLGIAAPSFHFSFIPGMPVPSPEQMPPLLVAMTGLSVLIGVGLFYRAACALFFMSYTYLFLCEKMLYQNHTYLVCLLTFWFFLVPANRVWSLDNRKGKLSPTVPRWSVLIFKLQISTIYFFAGVTKLNPDWLRGWPQGLWLAQRGDLPLIGPLVSQPWFVLIVTYGGIAVDLSMGFLLFAKRTFLPAALFAFSFHLLNSQLFRIDFFPWLMMSTIGLYAPYNWPRRLLAGFGIKKSSAAKSEATPDPESAAAPFDLGRTMPAGTPVGSAALWQRRLNTGILVFFHIYLLVQLVVPLRRFLYPGDMNWTNQGHRFCWSMLARSLSARQFEMIAINPTTGLSQNIDCTQYLTNQQLKYIAVRPDMVLQFTLYLADELEKQWGVRPVIHVTTAAKLNDHRTQLMIDPSVDLASLKPSLANAEWIVPLREGRKHRTR